MIDKPSDPRTAVADALLALQQATQAQDLALERLEAARLQLFDTPLVGGRREPPNEAHAKSYAESAGVMRRRAKTMTGADAAAELERAAWFDKRAEFKRTGGIMPREIRTPAERLSFVDSVRQALLVVSEAIAQVDPEDVSRFVGHLVDDEEKPLHGEQTALAASLASNSIEGLRGVLPALLEQLGLGFTEEGGAGFWPAPQPLVNELQTEAPAPPENNETPPAVA